MPNIFVNNDEVQKAVNNIRTSAEDVVEKLTSANPTTTDSRFNAIQDLVRDSTKETSGSTQDFAEKTAEAARNLLSTDSSNTFDIKRLDGVSSGVSNSGIPRSVSSLMNFGSGESAPALPTSGESISDTINNLSGPTGATGLNGAAVNNPLGGISDAVSGATGGAGVMPGGIGEAINSVAGGSTLQNSEPVSVNEAIHSGSPSQIASAAQGVASNIGQDLNPAAGQGIAQQAQAASQMVAQQPQNIAAPTPQGMANPPTTNMTSYDNGIIAQDQLNPMLQSQSMSTGSQQPSDLVHLSPDQTRTLADYLSSQQPSSNGGAGPAPGGAAGGREVGDIDLSRAASGDYEEDVIAVMEAEINANIPYAWGGGGLDGPSQGISDGGRYADQCGDFNKVGYDCSGFSRYVTYQTRGIEIPRVSQDQYNFVSMVSEPEIGDLGFPPGGAPGHVVVYAGDGMVGEAKQSGTNLMWSEAQADYEWGRVPE